MKRGWRKVAGQGRNPTILSEKQKKNSSYLCNMDSINGSSNLTRHNRVGQPPGCQALSPSAIFFLSSSHPSYKYYTHLGIGRLIQITTPRANALNRGEQSSSLSIIISLFFFNKYIYIYKRFCLLVFLERKEKTYDYRNWFYTATTKSFLFFDYIRDLRV